MFSVAFRRAVPGLLIAACVFLSSQARAADVSLVGGLSATSHFSRYTVAVAVDIGFDKTFKLGRVQFQPIATASWYKARDFQVPPLDSSVYVVGCGLRVINWWHGAFASFQLALANPHTDALSSTGQFISSIGYRWTHWEVLFRHISNGGFFGGMNLGETAILVGYRF